ncbi:MAG: hypothetical protein WC770_00560 [Phycisphaerae bacterium]
MAYEVDFEEVLKLFESHGWQLKRIYEPYRVFVKDGQLPWLIPVRNKKVSVEYLQKFKNFIQGQNEE